MIPANDSLPSCKQTNKQTTNSKLILYASLSTETLCNFESNETYTFNKSKKISHKNVANSLQEVYALSTANSLREKETCIKVTGVVMRNFERNPKKVPESCFMGMVQIQFYP